MNTEITNEQPNNYLLLIEQLKPVIIQIFDKKENNEPYDNEIMALKFISSQILLLELTNDQKELFIQLDKQLGLINPPTLNNFTI